MPNNDTQWWRPIAGSCAITIENVQHHHGGMLYFLEVHDPAGERHRFRAESVYWSGRDMRVQREVPPVVGRWEAVPGPGEVDLSDLGRLLNDGKPPTDNGEAVP